MESVLNLEADKTERVSAPRGTALVVDDDATNRLLLKSLLSKVGFEIVIAEDGAQAVAQYSKRCPDIIFMDVMMPVMDGFEAAKRIKALAGDEFIPIIFLTAISNEADLARCIETGGDDFLIKPVNLTLLQAKIQAMERIRDQQRELNRLHRQMKHDEEIAENIFSRVITRDNISLDLIRTLLRPAATFNGDMLLSAFSPSRDLYILLADFTGHGLAASIGALPASEVFRAMSAKGYSIVDILQSINRKLYRLLPTEMFMAATMMKIPRDFDSIMVCNCGMPDMLLLDAQSNVKARASSRSLSLGVTGDLDCQSACEYIAISQGDRILLHSDGVTEACNTDAQQFGDIRLIAALAETNDRGYAFDSVVRALDAFCDGAPQADDISLAEILCDPKLLPSWGTEGSTDTLTETVAEATRDNGIPHEIMLSLLFEGSYLRNADPVPDVINQLQPVIGDEASAQVLFTVFTELFNNALDHGVLGLDSSLKQGNGGFERYYNERRRRLVTLDSGYVHLSVRLVKMNRGGRILIQMEDSGTGFDWRTELSRSADEGTYSRRGIVLVRQLCKSLTYREPGNRVEAVCRWGDKQARE